MHRKPIHRGGIVSAGYDPVHRWLEVEFDTKRVLRFEGVGSQIAQRFLTSAEPFSYYRDVIEGEYTATELSAQALKDCTSRDKSGVPDALKALFGE